MVLVATLLATSADLAAAEGGEFDLRTALRHHAIAAPAPATATEAYAADVGGGGGDRASYAGKPCLIDTNSYNPSTRACVCMRREAAASCAV